MLQTEILNMHLFHQQPTALAEPVELPCKERIQPPNLTGDVPLPAPPKKGGKSFHFCSFDLLRQTLRDACGNGCLLKRISAVCWTLKSLR